MAVADTIQSMYANVGLAYDAIVDEGGTAANHKNLQNLTDSVKTIASKVPMGEYGKVIWIDTLDKTTDKIKLSGMSLATADDFNALCTALGNPIPEGTEIPTTYTLNGKTIPKDDILAFYSNAMPDAVQPGFLRDCHNLSFGELTIPNNVTTIHYDFLRNCRNWDIAITFGAGLTTLSNNFLRNCLSFNQPIDLSPATGLVAITDYFMVNCQSFNSPLTLAPSITTLGTNFLYGNLVFNQALDLSHITSIADGFLNLDEAFDQSITMTGVTSIGQRFLYKTSMASSAVHITGVDGTINNYFAAYTQMDENSTITLDGTWTSIGMGFLMRCYFFNSPISITGNNLVLGDYFCYMCMALKIKNITFGGTLKSIGNGFMYSCTSFNGKLVLPNTIETIGKWFMAFCGMYGGVIGTFDAYENCHLDFLENCTSIGVYFLEGCTNWSGTMASNEGQWGHPVTVNAPKLTAIPSNFMYGCTALRGPIDFSPCTSVTSIGYGLMQDCSSLLGITFPPNVQTIGSQCLQNCAALIDEVVLPTSVKTIDSYFMDGCFSYAQPFTIPANCKISSGYFMQAMANFVGPLYMSEGCVLGNEASSLLSRSNKVPSFTKGIALTGPMAQAYVTAQQKYLIIDGGSSPQRPHTKCRHIYLYDPDTDITAEDGAILITEKQ